jgi:hypothetical protein
MNCYLLVICDESEWYIICDVVSEYVCPHRASRNVCLTTVGIEPTNPFLYQLSYEIKSVRVDDTSELSLVPAIELELLIPKYHVLEPT